MNDVNIIRKKSIVILPENGVSAAEQLNNCLFRLNEKLDKLNLDKNCVLKQHIFLKEQNRDRFLEKKEMLNGVLDTYYVKNTPPTSIIAQAHANNFEAVMEITLAENSDSNLKIENRSIENLSYKVIRSAGYMEVFACGLTAADLSLGIREQSEISFSKMKMILDNEGLNFSDIIRQWNYIENILRIEKNSSKLQQNYQIFNDVRSKYYQEAEFNNGYPAATGIGMDTGGVVIDFIASSTNKNISVKAVKNPRQVDAHEYSKNVLIGEMDDKKTSPKFERAKAVSDLHSGEIYISGTAAIRGEETIEEKGIVSQTVATIENIQELIASNNLKKNGISLFNKVIISSLRVYVKNDYDINDVVGVCERLFPGISTLYLIADICRDNLLVEIEGKANI